jgi:recombination protein U
MKYPGGLNRKIKTDINYGNRGMNFEADINITNDYYLNKNIAVIYKKPTPIIINKVDYHSRTDAVIKEAHFRVPSTTDYNGIYKGKYIDFDAKETKLNYFPLSNIHMHQIVHLKRIIEHGGIGFILVNFTKLNLIYLLFGEDLFYFIDNETRKSIPLEYFKEHGHLIKPKYNPRIDYLEVINKVYFKGDVL